MTIEPYSDRQLKRCEGQKIDRCENPDMTIKQILAVGGLCFEFANFVGPSAISFAPRSYVGLRGIVWCVLFGTMVATAIASAGVVKASLGASQVQREQTNRTGPDYRASSTPL